MKAKQGFEVLRNQTCGLSHRWLHTSQLVPPRSHNESYSSHNYNLINYKPVAICMNPRKCYPMDNLLPRPVDNFISRGSSILCDFGPV